MELMQWLLFGPALLIAHWPLAGAAICAAGFAMQLALNVRGGRRLDSRFFREAPVFAGLLWLIFGLYETQMMVLMPRMSNTPAGNPVMRLDLIVLVPILYLLSGAAVLGAIRQFRTKS